ncbi:hypothetical protein [Lysobacter panacisoli]|uniref:Uncharacterized protein n=1 Tax=Lysobacter panacisoli TaxID=1255263 RepID=A0ABP9LB84_9GAMM|nr:hypothetical protein [Lysobacter panacisoli]
MTTPVDIYRGIDLVTVLSVIKDKESLQLTQRIIAGNRMVLEAQIAQMRQLEEALADRIKGLGR